MLKLIADNFIKEECLDTVAPLFAELVETTKKESGCIAYDLYVNENDHTHFVFVEEWTNREALDAHMASEHFTRLVPQIGQYAYKKGTPLFLKAF